MPDGRRRNDLYEEPFRHRRVVPEDLVVVVRAGTPISELQDELATRNQCLPLPPAASGIERLTAGLTGTVGGLVSANLPTRWDGTSKGVRYWVLGLTAVRADVGYCEVRQQGSQECRGLRCAEDVHRCLGNARSNDGGHLEGYYKYRNPEMPLRSEWGGSAPLMICRTPLSEGPAFAAGIPGSFSMPKPPRYGRLPRTDSAT